MGWRRAAKNASRLLAGALFMVVITPAWQHAAALTDSNDSEVQLQLCADDERPVLVMDEPRANAVLTEQNVTIKGTVERASAVEIFVDGTSKQKLDLGNTAVGFEQPLTIPVGDHSIRLVGYDLCNEAFSSITRSISITLTKNSTAPLVQTVVLAEPVVFYRTVSDAEAVQSADSPAGESSTVTPGNIGIDTSEPGKTEAGAGHSITESLSNWLDVGNTFSNIANGARAVAATGGVVLAVGTHLTAVTASQITSVASSGQTSIRKRRLWQKSHLSRITLAVRGAGALLVLALFVV
jgi:hypothetical protein